MGKLAEKVMAVLSGILVLVSLAQFILEFGYGKSGIAQNANNIFGMKCSMDTITAGFKSKKDIFL